MLARQELRISECWRSGNKLFVNLKIAKGNFPNSKINNILIKDTSKSNNKLLHIYYITYINTINQQIQNQIIITKAHNYIQMFGDGGD